MSNVIRKVRVCHVTSVHSNRDVRIFYKECISLAKNGYEVYLVAPGESFEENSVKCVNIPRPRSRFERFLLTGRAAYKAALTLDAEIYHLHDPELLPYGLKLKRKGKSVIFDSHEFYSLQITQKTYIPKLLRKIISALYYRYETHVCRRIDAVVVPCTIDGNNVFNNRARKTVFISNAPVIKELYDKYTADYTKKSRTVCCIGALSYARGITHIIKASYIAKATLILGGAFVSQNYFNYIKKLKEYQCVDYRGYVNRDDVFNILKESQVGFAIGLNIGQYNNADTIATKAYEYMSMGLPVIIPDYPYAKEVNEKYNCFILVSPDNVIEIANAISYLLDNPAETKEKGCNGRRAIIEEYNWGTQEEQLLGLYEELLAQSRGNHIDE